MELSEIQNRVAELEQQISNLPAGSITKKNVNGANNSIIVGQRIKNGKRNIYL